MLKLQLLLPPLVPKLAAATSEPNNNPPAGRTDRAVVDIEADQCMDVQVVEDDVFDRNKKNMNEDCSICLEEFETGDKCGLVSGCKHIYHIACIQELLHYDYKHKSKFSTRCPRCRRLVRVYIRPPARPQPRTDLNV
ncbi:RING/U-box superfamily protein [Euphorbia peplus]|nr:RING/U-box superfamily protein [Euphorbia peplus]